MSRLQRTIYAILGAVVMIIAGFGVARAVAPVSPSNIVSYQGRLLNASGVPVSNASASMVFKLYDSLTIGTCLWSNSSATCATEVARTVTLSSGLFSENLGDTGDSYAAISDSVFGNDESVYLEVVVNGETLSPRKRITAAPYAINSSLFDGINSSAFVQTGTTNSFDLSSAVLLSTGALQFEGSSVDAFKTTFNITNPTANRSITFQNGDGTVAFLSDLTGITADSLSFTDLADTMALDASWAVQIGSSYGVSFSSTGVPITDLLSISNAGFATTTTDVNALSLNFSANATSTSALNVATTFAGGAGGTTMSAIHVAGPSVTAGSGTDNVIGLSVDTITDPGALISSTGIQIGSGWDSQLSFNDATSVIQFSNTGTLDIQNSIASSKLLIDDATNLTTLSTDLAINGGDLTSSNVTFNFLDAVTDSTIIDIGGVTADLGNTVNIATNATTADTIAIGNSNASTVTSIAGGNAWSISTAGLITSANDLVLNGGDLTSTSATFNFLNATGNSATIDIGGVTADLGNTVNIATNATTADTIAIGNSNASTATSIVGGNAWSISTAGLITSADDLILNGGDITSTSATFNFLDAPANSATIDIGGVTTDVGNTVNIATNATTADTIAIGNSNATTSLSLTSGDWAISTTGAMTNMASISGNDNQSSITYNIGVTGADEGSHTHAFQVDGTSIALISAGGDGAGSINYSQFTYGTTLADYFTVASDNTNGDTIAIGNNNASTTIALTGGNDWNISTAGLITTADDVAINGGDITSTYGSFNFLDAASNSTSIDIGGVTTDLGNTISIATNSTTSDSIIIGNTNASTLVAISGGDDWSIASNGYAIFGAFVNGSFSTMNIADSTIVGGGNQTTTINLGGVSTDLANTISIATNATSADTITIGNTNATTATALKGGIVTLTGAATTGTTTSSAVVLSDTSLTTGTLLYGDIRGTSGTGVKFEYGAAVTQSSSSFTGLSLDLTNLTGANGLDMTNMSLVTKGQTRSGSGTEYLRGLSISSSASITQDTTTGKVYWYGVDVTSPTLSVSGGAGSVTKSSAYKATLNTITTSSGAGVVLGSEVVVPDSAIVTNGTMAGFYLAGTGTFGVITTGPAAGNLYGLYLPNISTPGAGTETGVSIGSGWDNAISGTTAGTNLISFTNFNVTTAGAITGTFATANSERLCWDASGGSDITDCTGTPGDYAEEYGTVDASIQAGDVVMSDPSRVSETIVDQDGKKGSKAWILKSNKAYQSAVVGIVSTEPNEVIGQNFSPEENPRPIALNGRVPVNVTNENGPIHVGDFVTTSSTAGKGMKATLAGRVIGMALSDFDGVDGQVMVQVVNTWYMGNLITNDGTSNVMTNNVIVAQTGTADAATPTFDSFGLALRGSAWNGSQAETVSLMMKNVVTDANNYRLSVRNTSGTEVAYVSDKGVMQVMGDVVVGGKLYPSDQNNIQTSKYIYYDGSAGPGGDFMRTNASGWSTGSYDFAEMFPSSDVLSPGDVVTFADQSVSVKRSSSSDKTIAGIISTRPGFLAGENANGSYPVALAGRVPTNVTNENGAIAVGDPLTLSKTSGFATKATKAGRIVGYALEPFDGSSAHQIIVFVHPGYWDGSSSSTTPGVTNNASQVSFGSSEMMTSLNMSGNINMAGNSILSINRLVGLSDAWSIDQDGTIKTEGLIKNIVTTHDNRKVETVAVTSPEAVITMAGSAELVDGSAEIRFATINADYNGVISAIAPIRVIATPNSPISLYISEKDQNHFVVKSFGGSTNEKVMFDWMVTAYRSGYEPDMYKNPPTQTEPVVTSAPSTTTATSVATTTADTSAPITPQAPEPAPVSEPAPSVSPSETSVDSTAPTSSPVLTAEPVAP